MYISLNIFCTMAAFFVMQVGIILTIAVCDLRGIGQVWRKGYITESDFLKIAAYTSIVAVAAFLSVTLSLAYAS